MNERYMKWWTPHLSRDFESEILNSKGIQHWLDDGRWRGEAESEILRLRSE